MECWNSFKPHKNCLDPFVCTAHECCLYNCDELGDYGHNCCYAEETCVGGHTFEDIVMGLTGDDSMRLLNNM